MVLEKRNFDKSAPTWDDNPTRVRLAADLVAAVADSVPLSTDMSMLDFGCGTGLLTLQLAPRVGSVTGVDSSQGMLGVLTAKAENLAAKNVRTVRLDIDANDTLEGSFDVIISSMTFHHLQNIDRVLDLLYRCMNPGGYLCIADLDVDGGRFHEDSTGVFHNGFEREAFREIVEKAGFANARMSKAAEVIKVSESGTLQRFTVFLASARKP